MGVAVTLSTGDPLLDRLTGGGFPCAGITDLYGPRKSGKKLLLDLAKQACKRQGLRVVEAGIEVGLGELVLRFPGVDLMIVRGRPPATFDGYQTMSRLLTASGAALVFVSQDRDLPLQLYGVDDHQRVYEPGGIAMRFNSRLRLRFGNGRITVMKSTEGSGAHIPWPGHEKPEPSLTLFDHLHQD